MEGLQIPRPGMLAIVRNCRGVVAAVDAVRAGAELSKAVAMVQRMRMQVVVMWLVLLVAIVAVRL